MSTPAFLTGSRAYGNPREDSDVDLVVLVDEADDNSTLDVIHAQSEAPDGHYDAHGSYSLRYGKLNLIVCTTQEAFDQWRASTNTSLDRMMHLSRPLTREEAVAIFMSQGINRPTPETVGLLDDAPPPPHEDVIVVGC